MSLTDDPLFVLNSKNHTLRILFFLAKQRRPVNQTMVRDGVGVKNAQTISNSLDVLELLKLIETKIDLPRTNWISLTDKGERVADQVIRIEALLKD